MTADSMLQTLATRLETHPPFDRLGPEAVRELVTALHVRYADHDEVLFEQGQPAQPHVFLLHKGRVRLDRDGEPAAVCEPGDLFGVRAHLASRDYLATATVEQDALLYCWPAERFVEWMERYPVLAVHLASGFAVEGPLARAGASTVAMAPQAQPVEPTRSLLTCAPTESVRGVAQRMSERRVGSMLVLDAEGCPVGIVTDADMRDKVVAAALDVEHTAVREVMSQPVVTVRDAPTVAEATIAMAQRGIHHLVTTVDGTPQTRATGIVSDHDLLVESGENPGVLVRTLARAHTDDDLRVVRERLDHIVAGYLEAELAVGFVARVVAAVTDQVTRRAIQLAVAAQGAPPAPFVWLALGSQGRREQILRTDQDNALVFEGGPHQGYFLELAERVVTSLNTVGFERCPANMMASNPDWCADLEHWQGVFSRWIEVPEPKALLHANIFFDFRALHGDLSLEARLRDHVFQTVRQEGRFLPLLAANALHNPAPLGFFGGFVRERSGEHKERFDLKARAMMPFTDAARTLSLDLGIREVGTVERFQAAAQADPSIAETTQAAARAFVPLLEVRTRQGLRANDSGRFVDLDNLDAFDRQRLRHAVRVLADVQRLLNVRYQTDWVR